MGAIASEPVLLWGFNPRTFEIALIDSHAKVEHALECGKRLRRLGIEVFLAQDGTPTGACPVDFKRLVVRADAPRPRKRGRR